jgi:hypothetical protein
LSQSRSGDFKVEAYFPSAYEEVRPHWNSRLALFTEVGARVVLAAENLEREDVPPWIKEIVNEKVERYASASEAARSLDVSNL